MSERQEIGLVYRFIGERGQYLNAVPARDLRPRDLLELEEREGITEEDIRLSGLYEPTEWAEIAPFCGAPLEDGGNCREPVAAWGLRCEEHGALTQITGIGPETAACLREMDVGHVGDLAALSDIDLARLADQIPRVSEAQMRDWRGQAREWSRE